MTDDIVHVAVAVIVNDKNQVLIAKRPDHVHQGGLWEFPGGKIEDGEAINQALIREIKEELDIVVSNPEPLIKIKHRYKDKTVLLDTQLIKKYTGNPVGAEGQAVKWKNISELNKLKFPAANKSIISALQLPDAYMITGKFESKENFKETLKSSLLNGRRIVQLRCKGIQDVAEYLELADMARAVCNEFGAILLLNTTVENFDLSQAGGLNLNSQAVFQYTSRPISKNKLLSVSCHNIEEIEQAELLEADIVLLSPVKETLSHPGVKGMGWETFNSLAENIQCPVYALGGMTVSDGEISKQHGAQGIAAISSLWLYEK